jgi:hypothetical protein
MALHRAAAKTRADNVGKRQTDGASGTARARLSTFKDRTEGL